VPPAGRSGQARSNWPRPAPMARQHLRRDGQHRLGNRALRDPAPRQARRFGCPLWSVCGPCAPAKPNTESPSPSRLNGSTWLAAGRHTGCRPTELVRLNRYPAARRLRTVSCLLTARVRSWASRR
jgi:hypothetical protein